MAVDHGFQTQEERRAGEKPPRPRLRLGAFLRDHQFTIEIEDDGRGIAWAALSGPPRRAACPPGATSSAWPPSWPPG